MIEEAIRSILADDSAVAAIVSSRIYPVNLPQQATLPAISYSKVSLFGKDLSHSGTNQACKSICQVSCWGRTAIAAKQLAAAVKAALHGFKGTVGSESVFYSQVVNEVDLFDSEVGVYQVPVDVLFHHRDV